jgi:hypothetical protein
MPGLRHAAKGRPIQAHDPATSVVTFGIEPVHGRIDEHPLVSVVFVQHHFRSLAKLNLMLLNQQKTALSICNPFGTLSSLEVRERKGTRQALEAVARYRQARWSTLSISTSQVTVLQRATMGLLEVVLLFWSFV